MKYKYKLGDRVLITGPKDPERECVCDGIRWLPEKRRKYLGMVARVEVLEWCNGKPIYYLDTGPFHYPESWLAAYPMEKPKDAGDRAHTRRVVIEITDDGAAAKYINGKRVEKEARIRRHHDDRPDDYAAARYAVDALFWKNRLDDIAEWASQTAKILRDMNWGDILFRAYVERDKK